MKILKVSALALATILPLPALAEGLTGSFLAARQAQMSDDYANAAHFFRQAHAGAAGDPVLLDGLIVSSVSAGAVADAIAPARNMEDLGFPSRVGQIVLLVDDFEQGRFDAVLTRIADERAIGSLADGLLQGWALLGQGDMDAALEAFDTVAAEPGLERFARYHKALALSFVGDLEGAEAIYAEQAGQTMEMTRRGALARMEVLSQLDHNEAALTLLHTLFGTDLDPELKSYETRLQAGEQLTNSHVTSVQDGAAEVFYSLSAALQSEASAQYTLLYAQLASALRPHHVDALLLTGGLLEDLGQPALATEAYRQVPREDPNFYRAEVGRADALRKSGRPDAAREVLTSLSAEYPLPEVHAALGDLERSNANYEAALPAYSAAIQGLGETDPGRWLMFYTRGMSLERLDRWDEAETDFRAALAINPDQPQLLNYFGYSLVEKNQKLDEALAMIQRAVELRPESGAIIDSLGWVLHRLGRNKEALPHLERAAELLPVDPVVNDHLGDVYWLVGRQMEARFQWTRALSFDPEEADAARIRSKLQSGLDATPRQEAGQPPAVARN